MTDYIYTVDYLNRLEMQEQYFNAYTIEYIDNNVSKPESREEVNEVQQEQDDTLVGSEDYGREEIQEDGGARGRKRKKNKHNWKRNIQKRLKYSGETHVGQVEKSSLQNGLVHLVDSVVNWNVLHTLIKQLEKQFLINIGDIKTMLNSVIA